VAINVNSIKKRQRTKKFPMTAGSWTGSDATPSKADDILYYTKTQKPVKAGLTNNARAADPGKLPSTAITHLLHPCV